MSLYATDSEISCGVTELVEVHDLEFDQFKQVTRRERNLGWSDHIDRRNLVKGRTYLFSDNETGNGKEMAKWIRKYKLGKLISSGWTKSTSTKRKINVWVWVYNGKMIPKAAK